MKRIILIIKPIKPNLKIGDKVIDLTAQRNNWVDSEGEVIDIDGSMIRVEYLSGIKRWKKHTNLKAKK